MLTGYITIIITGFHAMLLTCDAVGLNNTKNRQVVFYYYLMALEWVMMSLLKYINYLQ